MHVKITALIAHNVSPVNACAAITTVQGYIGKLIRYDYRCPSRFRSLTPIGVLSEGYVHEGPGVCLDDGQTEAYLRDMGMMSLASVWSMARRRPI